MYETPFYAVTAMKGTRYHDFETKVTITNKPTQIDTLTVGIRERLQNGGLKQTDANGKVISYKAVPNTSITFGKASPATEERKTQLKAALTARPATAVTPDPKTVQVDPIDPLEELVDNGEGTTDPATDSEPGLDDILNAAPDETTKPSGKGNTKAKGK